MRIKREKNMRLHSRFQILRRVLCWPTRATRYDSGGGREGLQDRRLPTEEETCRSYVSRHENLRDIAGTVSVREIIMAVSDWSGVPASELISARRRRDVTRWRNIIYLLAHELTYQSSVQIGNALNRDHTTVWAGVRRARHVLKTDRELEEAYNHIYSGLRNAVS